MKPSINIDPKTNSTLSRKTSRRSRKSSRLRRLVLASATALGAIHGTALVSPTHVVTAAECDCWDASCDACSSGGGSKLENNVVFKSLDSLAGGIEKVLGLDKSSGCDEFGCDDACDAASMQELMLPMHPMQLPAATYVPPATTAPMLSSPHVPVAPPTPIPVGPPVDVRPMGPPAYHAPMPPQSPVPLPPAVPMAVPSDDVPTPPAMNSVPQPVPQPTPQPVPTPEVTPEPKDEGSLFDALDDPFGDDEVRTYRPYRNVRPSGYLQRAGSAGRNGTPARKATHRTVAPILNAPVRQTSAIDQEPIGSGLPLAAAQQTQAKRPANQQPQLPTFKMLPGQAKQIVDIEPTSFLPSRR